MGLTQLWVRPALVTACTVANAMTPVGGTEARSMPLTADTPHVLQMSAPTYSGSTRLWRLIGPSGTSADYSKGFGLGPFIRSAPIENNRETPAATTAVADATTPQAEVLSEIQALTGLSWPRIAELIGVHRQTTFRWRNGEPADEARLAYALDVWDVLKEAGEQHGKGRELRAWLNRTAPMQRAAPYRLIADGRLDEARFLAMLAPTKVTSISEFARDAAHWEKHIADEGRTYIK